MDGFHLAHSFRFRVKGASLQCSPKAALSSTLFTTYIPFTNIFSRPMSLETEWVIPQPDWITFPQTLDSFGFLFGNVETFIGVGKYSQFQEILLTLPQGIYCLQETKSTHSDVLKLSHVHLHLSGTTDDPHPGVGFAIPTPLLPIVYDFHPWNSRIVVLILNTRPHRLALFTIYAPSTVQDQRLDLQRKHQFWEHLHTIFNHYKSDFVPVPMGDFNTRLYHNQVSVIHDWLSAGQWIIHCLHYETPSTLPNHHLSWDLRVTTSVHSPNHLYLCHTRPHSLLNRTPKTFPLHPLSSTRYSPLVPPPLFLSAKTAPPPPRRDFTSSKAKLKYNTSTLTAFGIPTPQQSVTPCPYIYRRLLPRSIPCFTTNPAGWGVFFESIFRDLYGPAGSLPFEVNGSNNTAELQTPLEAIAFLLLHPALPPHIIFHLDSGYVIDLLFGLSLFPLPILNWLFFYLTSIITWLHEHMSNSER